MQHLRLFPTNVGIFDVEDSETLNKELNEISFLFDGSHKFISRKSVWNLAPEYPAVEKLKNIFLDSVVEYAENYYNYEYEKDYFYMTESWAEYCDPGGYNFFPHNHRLTHVAAVYYVSVDDNTGDLDFIDPRGTLGFIGLNAQQSHNIFRFKPKNGQLILFPGWMTHFAHPNKSTITRKLIAANIRLRDDVQFFTKGSTFIPNVSTLKIS
jgi:uncharacterized protein (TIGR02466 family)